MLAVLLTKPGGPEELAVGQHPKPSAGSGELLVRVHATAVNRADTLQRAGQYPPPPGESPIIGLEAAGVVEAVGADCALGFAAGDRVMCLLAGGGYAQFVAVPEVQCMRVPDAFDFVQAAAIPETWLTAYQLLHFVAQLQPGETVLVHAAASGVGQAALQLVRLHGARAIATVGSADKAAACTAFGAVAAIDRNANEGKWAPEVLRLTEGKGVNVILDCVGASYVPQNAEVAAPEARWVVYGLMGGRQADQFPLGAILAKRIQLSGTTLRARPRAYKGRLVQAFSELLPRFTDGTLRPVVDHVFPLEQVADAHRRMEEGKNIGKLVLTVSH